MSKVLDAQGDALAGKIAENNQIKWHKLKLMRREQLIQNQTNQIIMQQYALINTYSQSVPMAIAGRDKDKVGMDNHLKLKQRQKQIQKNQE